jgi:hypothetical protein
MTRFDPISGEDIASSLRSGIRTSKAHVAYGSDLVRLAFGRHASGRIKHVASVDRGLECECFCPACSEALVARQGDKKAWHFAHVSGGSCRDALAASFAAYFVQLVRDGEAVALPDLKWKWGTSLSKRSLPMFQFERAEISQNSETGGFEARARAPGAERDVRIAFRSVRGRQAIKPIPGEESVLEIDLLEPMEYLFRGNGKLELDEGWVRRQLLTDAPRSWLYNAAADAMRDKIAGDRLQKHFAALDALEMSSPEGAGETEAEALVRARGLAHLIEGPSIRGDRFLGPTQRGWRAEVLVGLVLGEPSEARSATDSPGFEERDIIRLLGRRRLVKSADLMRPLPEDDAIEFSARVPDWRRPIDIVRDYLFWLWELDVIRARPGLVPSESGRGLIDDRLAGPHMPDWALSPDLEVTLKPAPTIQR